MSGKPGNRLPAHSLSLTPIPRAPVPAQRKALLPAEGASRPQGLEGSPGARAEGAALAAGAPGSPRRGRGPPSLEAPLDRRLRNSLPNRAQRQPESGSRSGVQGNTRGRQSPAGGLTTLASPAECPPGGSGRCPPTALNLWTSKMMAIGLFQASPPLLASASPESPTTST